MLDAVSAAMEARALVCCDEAVVATFVSDDLSCADVSATGVIDAGVVVLAAATSLLKSVLLNEETAQPLSKVAPVSINMALNICATSPSPVTKG